MAINGRIAARPGLYYQLLAGWGWTSLHWLGSLRQSTLVIHGNDDPIMPLINAKILIARIRKAKLHVIDDGHLFLADLASRARDQEIPRRGCRLTESAVGEAESSNLLEDPAVTTARGHSSIVPIQEPAG